MHKSLDLTKENRYWTRYYSRNSMPFPPSPFAYTVLPYLFEGQFLCELGCGNGRDSVFFAKHKIRVDAFDLVKDEIDFLQENYSSEYLNFSYGDFSKMPSDPLKYDAIYSRFTIHSISEEMENSVLEWAFGSLRKSGYLFVESRSINDPLLNEGTKLGHNENFTDHYRRYMDKEVFCEKLKKIGFRVILAEESDTFAVTKTESPVIDRVIATISSLN